MTADVLPAARETARARLSALAAAAAAEGMPRVEPRGQLIRPLAALAAADGVLRDDPRLWHAALAVQLAHEASLVHDDIVDGAATRRGVPTAAAAAGVGPALVLGDHLLTWAYRMAARAGSLDFAARFAAAVERTVAGEVAQGRSVGRRVTEAEYEAIARDKAGALLGCALAAAPSLAGADADAHEALGRRLGLLYQRLDDLLDFCPSTDSGKPALGDYAQGRWTWVLDHLPAAAFGREPCEVRAALHAPGPDGVTPFRRALAALDAAFDAFERDRAALLPRDTILAALTVDWRSRACAAADGEAAALGASAGDAPGASLSAPGAFERDRAALLPRDTILAALTADWRSRACAAADGEAAALGASAGDAPGASLSAPGAFALSRRIRERVPAPDEWERFLGRNSRSFAFAARFFPRAEGERVARVYAFCRVTDDLVDRPEGESPEALEGVLDEWAGLARRAYDGEATGVPLLDVTMREMAGAGVPFVYVAELAEGMRMDLRRETYPSLAALRVYTHRVAAVVGMWLTELSGVHDAPTLRRAAAMGHAMQTTNILRDVGEDLRAGRLYLPADGMARHRVGEESLRRAAAGRGPMDAGYRVLLEEMMDAAEADYRAAFAALPRLPGYFQRPAAVAGHVYRGIHGALRRQGYDNLRRRASTSPAEKAVLAVQALWELREARRRLARLDGDGDGGPVRLPDPAPPVLV